MKFISLRVFALIVVFLVSSACAQTAIDPAEWNRVVGLIDIGSGTDLSPIQLPEVVHEGVPFTAIVTTYGSSTCVQADGAEAQVNQLTAQITPYDLRRTKGICTDDLARHPRDVTLTFNTAGDALVEVIGQQAGGEWVRYEAHVSVQP